MSVGCIVPALNEARRIQPVLRAIVEAELVDDILVVSDGSTDDTYERALEISGVRAIELAHNAGKGGAMAAGAHRMDTEIVVFLDADLQGLNARHIDSLIRPVLDDQSEMCVGLFKGGRFLTDLAQKIAPVISGQRAIRRDTFLSIPGLSDVGMGVEAAITKWAAANEVRVSTVEFDGVTHTMKEEKMGTVRGFASRMMMYWDIGKVLVDGKKIAKERKRQGRLRADI